MQYDRIDVSEGIYINKLSALKECMLYQYWYFKAVSYKLEPHVCNCCHDILMMAHELKHLPILNVNSVDYRCIL